jgi:hypothetical protein
MYPAALRRLAVLAPTILGVMHTSQRFRASCAAANVPSVLQVPKFSPEYRVQLTPAALPCDKDVLVQAGPHGAWYCTHTF